jgi:hypothetical protein
MIALEKELESLRSELQGFPYKPHKGRKDHASESDDTIFRATDAARVA